MSLEEFYGYVGGSAHEAIYDYMQFGGMPLAVLKNDDDKKKYLKDLFETTYLKDIIEHMCVTFTVDLSIIIVEGSFRGGLSDGRQYDRRSVSET